MLFKRDSLLNSNKLLLAVLSLFTTAQAVAEPVKENIGLYGGYVADIEAMDDAGTTEVLNSTTTDVNEQKGSFKLVEEAPTIEKVATALNALGVSTRDMMSIFQTMKRAWR